MIEINRLIREVPLPEGAAIPANPVPEAVAALRAVHARLPEATAYGGPPAGRATPVVASGRHTGGRGVLVAEGNSATVAPRSGAAVAFVNATRPVPIGRC